MNITHCHSPHALYSVGGRLYKIDRLTATSLRLKDLLDGQFLLFKRDEALLMIQQQDLIKVKRSTIQHWCRTDPRYAQHIPPWELFGQREILQVSVDRSAELRQLHSDTPHYLQRDADPLAEHRWRKGAMERRHPRTRPLEPAQDSPTTRHDHSPWRERQQLFIYDEYACTAKLDMLIQEQILTVLKRFVMTLTKCPFSCDISAFTLQPAQDRLVTVKPRGLDVGDPNDRVKGSLCWASYYRRGDNRPDHDSRMTLALPDGMAYISSQRASLRTGTDADRPHDAAPSDT